jgi:MYXO-CTERM domain-containing protein
MFRPLACAVLSLAASHSALAGVWTVDQGGAHDFHTVADALGDIRVTDGDVLRILSGTYGGFDTGDKALTIEPGNSPGLVSIVGNMRVRPASTVNFEIAGYDNGIVSGVPQYDSFLVSGNVSYEGILAVRLTGGFAPVFGDSFKLIQSAGTISFTGTTNMPALAGGLSWNVQVVTGSEHYGSGATLVASVVPAPGAAALIGLAGLVTTRRRRD